MKTKHTFAEIPSDLKSPQPNDKFKNPAKIIPLRNRPGLTFVSPFESDKGVGGGRGDW